MAAFTPAARFASISVGLIAIGISLALVATHHEVGCQYQTGDGGWNECDSGHLISCTAPAVNYDASISIFGTTANFELSCPWREGTSTVSYVALGLAALFVIFYAFSPRLKSFNVRTFLLIWGIISMGALLASFILMIIDMVDGNNGAPDDHKQPGLKFTTHQVPFIINSILIVLAFVSTLALTMFGVRPSADKGELLPAESSTHQYYYQQ